MYKEVTTTFGVLARLRIHLYPPLLLVVARWVGPSHNIEFADDVRLPWVVTVRSQAQAPSYCTRLTIVDSPMLTGSSFRHVFALPNRKCRGHFVCFLTSLAHVHVEFHPWLAQSR
jgi:hypothetical protein